jgi:hypothetical protein
VTDEALAPADLVILAIQALQIAPAEKYITDPTGSADGRFFSPVDAYGTDVVGSITATIPQQSGIPVHSAVTGAQQAMVKFLQDIRVSSGTKVQFWPADGPGGFENPQNYNCS